MHDYDLELLDREVVLHDLRRLECIKRYLECGEIHPVLADVDGLVLVRRAESLRTTQVCFGLGMIAAIGATAAACAITLLLRRDALGGGVVFAAIAGAAGSLAALLVVIWGIALNRYQHAYAMKYAFKHVLTLASAGDAEARRRTHRDLSRWIRTGHLDSWDGLPSDRASQKSKAWLRRMGASAERPATPHRTCP